MRQDGSGMDWLRRLLDATRHFHGRSVPRPAERPSNELTDQQRRENAWARQGWTHVWHPTRTSPGGARRRYWARPDAAGLLRLFEGRAEPPPLTSAPHFYVNGGRVYRADGHPDGPSSVPYYVVNAGRVLASEGYPSGPSERVHFRVSPLRLRGKAVSVRTNPRYEPPA